MDEIEATDGDERRAPEHPHADWIEATEGGERPQLVELAERLERERPVPAAAFRGALRRRLVAGKPQAMSNLSPGWARALIGLCGGSGALALAIAALGVLGSGPFAA